MQTEKKRYHRGNVREDLIEAAEAILHSEGLEALSLRRVAREVGVAPSAVYNHFRNREALLAAIAAAGYRQLTELELKSYSAKRKSPAVVRQLARDYLHFAIAHPALYRLMFSPSMVEFRNDPELGEAGDSSFGLSVNWWYGEAAYDPARPATEYPYALSMWAIMHGLAMQIIDGLVTMDSADKAAIDAVADSISGILLDGVREGLGKLS